MFGQNWALSILLQDWVAPAYQAAMIFVSCMLAGWLFLNGFITKSILNAVSSVKPS